MTVETRYCPGCGQPADAGANTCAACGEVVPGADAWPTWHGQPTSDEAVPTTDAVAGDGPAAEFQELTLDPVLTNAPSAVAGSRGLAGWFTLLTVVWIVAEIMFARGNPAGIWTVIWYMGAVGTIVAGGWLLAVTWRRSRTHGWRTALRRLVT